MRRRRSPSLALVVCGAAVAYAGLWLALFSSSALGPALLVAAGATTPVTAWVIARGRWSSGAAAAVQAGAVAVGIGALVGGAVLGVVRAGRAWQDRDDLAVSAGEVAGPLLVAAAAIAALAVLLALLPVGARGTTSLALTAIAVLLLGSGGLAAGAESGCSTFRFSHDRWRAALAETRPDERRSLSDAERLADAIDRCALLDGATRTEVRAVLGPPTDAGAPAGTWRWGTRWAHAGIGPGDPGALTVTFGRTGRATTVLASGDAYD